MAREVEFFFDVGSPTTYLAWTQLPDLCRRKAAQLVYRPMLLGGVFQTTGNASPAMIPAKASYMLVDLQRFAARYGVPFTMNPYFMINTLTLMRILVAIQIDEPERFDKAVRAIFNSIWVDALNVGDVAVVGRVLDQAGFDSQKILSRSGEHDVKDRLKANTEEAVRRRVFGAPTVFVGDEMFFGQDRLDFISEALDRAA